MRALKYVVALSVAMAAAVSGAEVWEDKAFIQWTVIGGYAVKKTFTLRDMMFKGALAF